MKGENYAVNNSTLMALVGLYFFPIAGILMLIQSAFRLVACVWNYIIQGYNLPSFGLGLALATICFITAVLCHRGLVWSRKTLTRHRLAD
ncbi:hypothetical protein K5A76_004100 [Salmonella enterica subsp. enterica serovar Bredeney]|nr:hypothetical protein [Salmonella enterica]EDU2040172.1 hypothetical protein [Salmonella enterica subsp. enterica serovar Florida]EHY9683609.1 hypothetical protein [Salmonella enterica subsp. enterica serovar Bredeney]EBF1559347.1 hypothetical protein [Salmonella enterica]EIB4898406.1 hypothetical protein [Salmonella enterica subsp. enterica serovar Bredeney]